VLLLATFVVAGLAAPWLAPHNPASIDLLHRLEGPSAAHWAGTDELGRDTLSRLMWGARLSLTVSVSVVAVSLALGLAVGGLAGYLGGWVDTALTTFAMNTFLALPGILLAIAFAAFLGPGFANLVLALAIGGWAGYARLVRAQVMAVRDREYVDAARALGASGLRIFFRHILPNIVQPILVQAAIGMAGVILAEATLSFLGLGIPAPAPSWAPCSTTPGCTCSTHPTWCSSLPRPWPARCLASTSSAMPCATNWTRAHGWRWGSDDAPQKNGPLLAGRPIVACGSSKHYAGEGEPSG
jgi:peptide/nickel transport system permease protein